jgi:hypothetical protein
MTQRALTTILTLKLTICALTGAADVPFDALDNVEGDHVDLLFMPVDPMVLAPGGATLWAVNTHGSTVVGYDLATGAPVRTIAAPWGPVSIEYWVSPVDGHHELLVASRGTYGVTRLDPATGGLLGFIELPAEPADLLVDPASGHLFAACSAQDVVIEINLRTGAVYDRYEIETTRHLLFLSSDGAGAVLVAPMLSGNNSMTRSGGQVGFNQAFPGTNVVDMADPTVATVGLPDHDLFRLVPGPTPFTGTVAVAATALGTNLFAHGVNPRTGDFWIVGTEANNKDPDLQSEPAVKGEIVFNRLTITTLDPQGAVGAADHTIVLLDDADPSTPAIDYQAGFSVGQPYDFAFTPEGGAVVVGILTDNAVLLGPAGARIREWNVGEGAIPRGVVVAGDKAYVYCWGTNEIEVYDLAGHGVPMTGRLDLGYDPTPRDVREGRALFYDGDNSELGNASCNSCHLDVGMDFLVWNLSDWPVDDKGPMATQNLRGIEPLLPYHWRGERSFLDFNPAFAGLLGGTPLGEEPGGTFEKFQRFVFQVQNPANPFAHPDRVVSDDPALLYGFNPAGTVAIHGALSAVNGQNVYFTKPNVGPATCQDCHTLPTGTANDFFHDGAADQDHRSSFDVTAYNALWRKELKSRVTVAFPPPPNQTEDVTQVRAPLGVGTAHAGNRAGVFEFVFEQFGALTPEERQDAAFFLHQLDSGLAPAVHRAALLDEDHPETEGFVGQYLLAQAQAGNCDVAAFGSMATPQGLEQTRWYWDGASFVSDDPGLPARQLADFAAAASTGNESHLFLGLPVGMGRRWAVDYDGDALINGAEAAAATDPYSPDSDRDGFYDGVEVAYSGDPLDPLSLPADDDKPVIEQVRLIYVTTQVAKLIVETSEPTRVELDYATAGAPAVTATSPGWKDRHTIVLTGLEKSYATTSTFHVYGGEVRAHDQAQNPGDPKPLPSFQTEPFIVAFEQNNDPPNTETVLDELSFVNAMPASGGYTLTWSARVIHQKDAYPTPLADHVVVARVLLKKAGGDDFFRVQSFTMPGASFTPVLMIDLLAGVFSIGSPTFYAGLGPFLLSTVTGGDGYATLEVTLPNAEAGDQVRLSIETVALVDPASWDPASWSETVFPTLEATSLWHFPATATANRATEPVTLP